MNSSSTVFLPDMGQTDKTDETDLVCNEAFLVEVFGLDLAKARPLVVSFKGNPVRVPKKAWFGRPWASGSNFELSAEANNYFSLAVFRPDEAGQYRRRKARFQALYSVMLDDVGSKVAMERLTLPPSWLLETSPGNYQAGYLLREPLCDGLVADRLMNAIVEAGLCDPGQMGQEGAWLDYRWQSTVSIHQSSGAASATGRLKYAIRSRNWLMACSWR